MDVPAKNSTKPIGATGTGLFAERCGSLLYCVFKLRDLTRMVPDTFTKMHGLGNDFIVLDCLRQAFSWTRQEIITLAERHTGIGFDQLLLIEPAATAEVDFSYRIFNGDGNEVEQCGNGARCVGKYLRDNALFDFSRPARIAVKRGQIAIAYCGERDGGDRFRVEMGVPDVTRFTAAQESVLEQRISFRESAFSFATVAIGNPHAVTVVRDTECAPVAALGAFLQHHPLFPEQVNVGFMALLDRGHIRLRVFERGVGETRACGTGACAAVAAGIARGLLDDEVVVAQPGGDVAITWQGIGEPLFMTGPAHSVFHGRL